jgi:hypothetical protein
MSCLLCLAIIALVAFVPSIVAVNLFCVAATIQAKGLETVIFEKNPGVSGKCQAYCYELQVA